MKFYKVFIDGTVREGGPVFFDFMVNPKGRFGR